MKHIFYGEVVKRAYHIELSYWDEVEYTRFHSYDIVNSKEQIDRLDLNKEYRHRLDYYEFTEEYIKFSSTDSITERLLDKSYVKVNGEELFVNKVVQDENGDIICYTNKILNIVEDDIYSSKNAQDLINYLNIKIAEFKNSNIGMGVIELTKEDREKLTFKENKKWYQLWK